jgi:hypothetical protein
MRQLIASVRLQFCLLCRLTNGADRLIFLAWSAFPAVTNARRHEKENGNTLKGGFFMAELNVTGLAVAKLKEYMQANNIDSALRVALMQGG